MATLQGAIQELIAQIATVSGINDAPNEPREQAQSWPAAFPYATDGRLSRIRASTEDKSLHTVNIAVIMPRKGGQEWQVMLPLYEPIVAALLNHLNGRTSSHYSTWGELSHTLSPIQWGGMEMFGYIFTISELKIINAL